MKLTLNALMRLLINSIFISVVSIVVFFRIRRKRAAARSRESLRMNGISMMDFISLLSSLSSEESSIQSKEFRHDLISSFVDVLGRVSTEGCEVEKERLEGNSVCGFGG